MRSPLLLLALMTACGGNSTDQPSPAPTVTPSATAASYDLHEWGLVSAGPSAFEVAAGPGQRPVAIAVDKPVLYVHPQEEAPFDLSIRVSLGAGLEVAEHFPPTTTSPLEWRVRVGGRCRGTYPTVDDSRCPDGYCETRELPLYETDDAACLDLDGVRVPLLFYRLRAAGAAPSLPLSVAGSGPDIIVTNDSLARPVGSVWRVTWIGNSTRASRVDLPGVGEHGRLPAATGSVDQARSALRSSLSERGLSDAEAAVFTRAWDRALFGGLPQAVDEDVLRADEPVDPTSIDELTDDLPIAEGAPRVRDALLYWLPDSAIEALARVEATPAPRGFARAFLVRQAL